MFVFRDNEVVMGMKVDPIDVEHVRLLLDHLHVVLNRPAVLIVSHKLFVEMFRRRACLGQPVLENVNELDESVLRVNIINGVGSKPYISSVLLRGIGTELSKV